MRFNFTFHELSRFKQEILIKLNQQFFFLFVFSLCYYNGCSSKSTLKPNKLDIAIHSRDDWKSLPIDSGYTSHKIKFITLHHSGVVFEGDTPIPEYMRNIQKWSRSERNWPDIPYHFLIDLKGKTWEGKPLQYKGDTNTEYDPTGHALISVIGNYEEQEISSEQLDAVVKLMAALCKSFGLSTDKIKSHKDFVPSTLCPGKNLYSYMKDGSLIEKVNTLLN